MNIRNLSEVAANGACNVKALINGLAEATAEMSQSEIRSSLDVKMVVGQISYLLGESLGPSEQTIAAYGEREVQSG